MRWHGWNWVSTWFVVRSEHAQVQLVKLVVALDGSLAQSSNDNLPIVALANRQVGPLELP